MATRGNAFIYRRLKRRSLAIPRSNRRSSRRSAARLETARSRSRGLMPPCASLFSITRGCQFWDSHTSSRKSHRDNDPRNAALRTARLMNGFALKADRRVGVDVTDDPGGAPRLSRGAHLSREDRSPGPRIPARLLREEKIERERERERERLGLRTHERVPLELQIYAPHGTRPGR